MTAASGTAAIANADRFTSYNPPGYCLKWVRGECWQVGSLYGSAIEAWNGAQHKHPGDRNPPDGAPCFYKGGTYGHIVIYRKHDSGRIKSTDCTYSGKVSDAALSWPETAWGDTYLGWTEDLNGYDLPLGGQPEPKPEEDDMPDYVRARLTKGLKVKAQTWTSLPWDRVDNGPDYVKAGDQAIYCGGKKLTVTLTAAPTTGGDAIRTRFLERETQSGEAVTTQTWPAVEHKVTGGSTGINDSRSQSVPKGRRLVAQIWLPEAATLTDAEINALLW